MICNEFNCDIFNKCEKEIENRIMPDLCLIRKKTKKEENIKTTDLINHPNHYTFGKYEVMDVIEDWGFNSNFRLACALKYLARCEHKGKKIEDLKKCIWYLEREISKCKEGK
jgi:hypothetical protein